MESQGEENLQSSIFLPELSKENHNIESDFIARVCELREDDEVPNDEEGAK